MNKKGFTLIEIIVVIALLAVVGGGIVTGVNLVNDNIKNKKLEDIEEKIYQAVQIYIETNEEAAEQLYSKNNGVFIPLTVLKNEGLMKFDDIDIEGEYVISLLGDTESNDKCVGATTIGSWTKGEQTIYICGSSKESGNYRVQSGNLADAIITNAKKSTGLDDASYYKKEPIPGEKTLSMTKDDYGDSYYFSGEVKDNYLNFAGMCWRIVRVQGDGSIKLILEDQNTTCDSDDFSNAWNIGGAVWGYKKTKIGSGYNSWSYYLNDYGKSEESEPTMKDLLNNWINAKNIPKDKLKLENWCIGTDTTLYDGEGEIKTDNRSVNSSSAETNYYYSQLNAFKHSNLRINSSDQIRNYFYMDNGQKKEHFTFECDSTSKKIENSYIASLTVTEVLRAGGVFATSISHMGTGKTYLRTIYHPTNTINSGANSLSWYTISIAGYSKQKSDYVFTVYYGDIYNHSEDSGSVYYGSSTSGSSIRPAIVLKTGITFSKGEGTIINPYVIEEN